MTHDVALKICFALSFVIGVGLAIEWDRSGARKVRIPHSLVRYTLAGIAATAAMPATLGLAVVAVAVMIWLWTFDVKEPEVLDSPSPMPRPYGMPEQAAWPPPNPKPAAGRREIW